MTATTIPSGGTANVTGAIRAAARVTGADFQYLLTTARVESGLDPAARAQTSSAGGLFQFIDQTWLGMLKQAGEALGYGREASAISRNEAGRFVVADPEARAAILRLKQDPTASALMAGAFTRSNAADLRERLGREATPGELYIAHFLGAGGAAQLISRAQATPGAKAIEAFPDAARANRSIFFDSEGRARDFATVTHVLAARFQTARKAAPGNPAMAETTNAAKSYAAAPFALRGTVTAQESVFHNPYRASERLAAQNMAEARSLSPNEIVRSAHEEIGQGHVVRDDIAQSASPVTAYSAPQRFEDNSGLFENLFQDMRRDVQALFTRS